MGKGLDSINVVKGCCIADDFLFVCNAERWKKAPGYHWQFEALISWGLKVQFLMWH